MSRSSGEAVSLNGSLQFPLRLTDRDAVGIEVFSNHNVRGEGLIGLTFHITGQGSVFSDPYTLNASRRSRNSGWDRGGAFTARMSKRY
jgi:hypothetical protein